MAGQKKRGKRAEAEKGKQGSSLVIVICVAALLMAFALAMLYTAGTLLSRANRRLEQERSYRLAQSFAQVLDAELKQYTKPADNPPTDSFYTYACKFLDGSYGEYDPDHPDETIFHYTGASVDTSAGEDYGRIQVRLYKEANQEQNVEMSGSVPGGDPGEILHKKIQRYDFTVEVSAEIDDVVYHYETEYRQLVTYDVEFYKEGSTEPIFWDTANSQWHTGSQSGPEYDAATDGAVYRYQEDRILECTFENAY